MSPLHAGLTDEDSEQLAEFARRLKAIRTERGLSQSDLARLVWGNYTDPTTGKVMAKHRDAISGWESGNRAPSERKLHELTTALGIEYEDLAPSMLASKMDREPDRVLMREVKAGVTHVKINAMLPSKLAAQIYLLVTQGEIEK
jgi:transcriptional regulator with XRE-family HTH domain